MRYARVRDQADTIVISAVDEPLELPLLLLAAAPLVATVLLPGAARWPGDSRPPAPSRSRRSPGSIPAASSIR